MTLNDDSTTQGAQEARTKAVSPGSQVGTASKKRELALLLISRAAPTPTKNYPTAPSREGYSHVYVAVSAPFAKIGFAANLRISLSNMRVGNPHGIEIARYWEMPADEAAFIENVCHHDWIEWCVVGEWHYGTAEDAIKLVEKHMDLRTNINRLKTL